MRVQEKTPTTRSNHHIPFKFSWGWSHWRARLAIAATLFSGLVVGCAGVAPTRGPVLRSTDWESSIDRNFSGFTSQGIHSAVVSVVSDSGKPLIRSFGLTGGMVDQPVDQNTVYQIASISKVFTAIAIFRLAEQSRVELDSPITRWLPELKAGAIDPKMASITTRQLLCHASGLPNGGLYAWYPTTGSALLSEVARVRLLDPPGARIHYSNLGYLLLSEIIRRASGMDPRQYVTEEILSPLHLARTGYLSLHVPAESIAMAPAPDESTIFVGQLGDLDGGMYSTTYDLIALSNWLFGRADDLKPSRGILDSLAQPYHTTSMVLGPGWCPFGNLRTSTGRPVLLKRGFRPGFYSGIYLDMKSRTSVILLSSGGLDIDRVASDMLNTRFGCQARYPDFPSNPSGDFQCATNLGELGEYAGKYDFYTPPGDGPLDFEMEGDRIVARAPHQTFYSLGMDSGWVELGYKDVTKRCWLFFDCKYRYVKPFAFCKTGNKKVILERGFDGFLLAGESRDTTSVTQDDPGKWIGAWTGEEEGDTLWIVKLNGSLFLRDLRLNPNMNLWLEPVSATEFRVGGSSREYDFHLSLVNDSTLEYRFGKMYRRNAGPTPRD